MEKVEKPEVVSEPLKTGTLGPQPQETLSDGPRFNFSDLAVFQKETSLREVIGDLKSMLQVFATNCTEKSGYLALSQQLTRIMPELYRRYDAYVSTVLDTGEEKVACGKGCSHCCSHYVTSVEPYELLFLHTQIRNEVQYPGRLIALHRRVTLFKSLLSPRKSENDQPSDEDKALYRYYLRGQPCPFLCEGGVCSVYENRPMSCRMFYSLSHPSLCKGKSVISAGNRNFLIELPEDIEADLARAGAYFASISLPESLFEGLLEINEHFGQFDHEEK